MTGAFDVGTAIDIHNFITNYLKILIFTEYFDTLSSNIIFLTYYIIWLMLLGFFRNLLSISNERWSVEVSALFARRDSRRVLLWCQSSDLNWRQNYLVWRFFWKYKNTNPLIDNTYKKRNRDSMIKWWTA